MIEQVTKLKQQLELALLEPKIDYGRILELASHLSRYDPEFIRFTVDAGLISRLGRELVAKKETAVSELIKNTYDADAVRARITFIDCNKPGGSLHIRDNGQGMTRDQLINGFMRLASTDKIHNPVSKIYKRTRAGRKGIGRFAAQRLGQRLTVITQTEDADYALKIHIDWGKFEADLDLISIENQIQIEEKKDWRGTILMIAGLVNAWSEKDIQNVYRHLTDLVQPFPLSREKSTQVTDPGFDIEIYHRVGDQEETVASVGKLVYEYALAEIEGFVDSNGTAAWSIESKQLEINEQVIAIEKDTENSKSRYQNIRNVNFKAYYYIYNTKIYSNYLPKAQNSLILKLARERGGIRVYRNGFRVLPYGESPDDWLKLDKSSARRQLLPPHANQNFFGFVELIDVTESIFEETSSREGLIENDAFEELVDFVSRVLRLAVLRVAEARDRKKKPTKAKEKSPVDRAQKAVDDIKKATEEIINLVDEAKESEPEDVSDDLTDIKEYLQELQSTVEILSKAVEEETIRETQLLEELNMLRILASLGLSIGEFTHEIEQGLIAIRSDIKSIQALHSKGKTREYVNRLERNIGHVRMYASYFDRAASENVHRELRPQEMRRDVLIPFWKVALPTAARYGIDMPEPTILGYDLFTVPMHPSEWASILFNFFTNSVKAIRRARSDGKILLSAKQDDKTIFFDFADNGNGIAAENQERIFDAFFTTSSPPSPYANTSEQDELLGTGLGLKIVRDIVNSYNGNITLIDAPEGYITCFRIEIPAASDE